MARARFARVLRLVGMAQHPETNAEREADPSHPGLVAQPVGERLCLTHEPHGPLDLTERVDGVAKIEADVDRLLDDLAGLGDMCGRGEGSLEMGARHPAAQQRAIALAPACRQKTSALSHSSARRA